MPLGERSELSRTRSYDRHDQRGQVAVGRSSVWDPVDELRPSVLVVRIRRVGTYVVPWLRDVHDHGTRTNRDPALTGLAFPFTPTLWVPLILLQITLLIRVIGGLTGSWEWRRWGAMLNAITLTIFLLMIIAIVARGQALRRRTRVVAV